MLCPLEAWPPGRLRDSTHAPCNTSQEFHNGRYLSDAGGFLNSTRTIRRTFQFLSLSKCSLQTSFATSHEEVTQFASHWHERCLKDSEFENSIKKMKPSQMKIPMVEFGEVKFVPAVPRSKTSLKPTTRQQHRLAFCSRDLVVLNSGKEPNNL